ncbi:XRE family transcriptional regulator [Enterovirga rhinocerotis]|uniref:XRE family transcriptional regulator n=2 Tax=Enterovirga rhinocerotis TaxID=1339210 RepID=A0A4R7C146_9HYPH|nr:XRE family transcriptional regulator [Enterovirga rhinocerotis]
MQIESMEPIDDDSAAGADAQLGRRIRHLRKARELSLKDVAERSGLSVSFISQIERGRSSASVRVLVRIANALNVRLSGLFDESDDDEAIVQRRETRRRIAFRDTSISKELVTPTHPNPKLDVYLITIEPGGSTGGAPYAHSGAEAGIVVKGVLELCVEGETHVLREGDGFSFDSNRPHQFGNPGTGLTQVIWVNSRAAGE